MPIINGVITLDSFSVLFGMGITILLLIAYDWYKMKYIQRVQDYIPPSAPKR